MRIIVLAVGKIREKYLAQAVDEYLKRLGRYAKVSIIEVAEEQVPESLSPAEQAQVRARESERLLARVPAGQYVIALAIDGTAFTSEVFAAHLQQQAVGRRGDVTFLIGGSLGLSDDALRRADFRLTLGPMTFPHQLVRVILLEQVYRAFKIMRGEPYHK